MRFIFLESLCDIMHLKPLAQAAEAAGFDAFALPESIIYPSDFADACCPESASCCRKR